MNDSYLSHRLNSVGSWVGRSIGRQSVRQVNVSVGSAGELSTSIGNLHGKIAACEKRLFIKRCQL